PPQLNDGTGVTLSTYVAPDPSRTHKWFNDFDIYTAAQWVVTASGSATETIANADGGILVLDTGTTVLNDHAFLQWAGVSGTVAETFTFDSARGCGSRRA